MAESASRLLALDADCTNVEDPDLLIPGLASGPNFSSSELWFSE